MLRIRVQGSMFLFRNDFQANVSIDDTIFSVICGIYRIVRCVLREIKRRKKSIERSVTSFLRGDEISSCPRWKNREWYAYVFEIHDVRRAVRDRRECSSGYATTRKLTDYVTKLGYQRFQNTRPVVEAENLSKKSPERPTKERFVNRTAR